jgi:hypothetical protein
MQVKQIPLFVLHAVLPHTVARKHEKYTIYPFLVSVHLI